MTEIENEVGVIALEYFTLFLIVLFLLLLLIKRKVIPFVKQRNYIIMEMNRSTDEEYDYWRKKLKRHYVRQIPVLGKIIIKHSKSIKD